MASALASSIERVPATTAVQVFGIVPGIAGGIAGFWLASRIAGSSEIRTADVMRASLFVAAATMFAVLLIPSQNTAE